MQDQNIVCRDCNQEFVWTAEEQEYYQTKGLNRPVRCAACRATKRAQFAGGGFDSGRGGARPQTEITCYQCGKADTVPFQPKDPGRVLCRDCFKTSKT